MNYISGSSLNRHRVLIAVEFNSGGGLEAGIDNFRKWSSSSKYEEVSLVLDIGVDAKEPAFRIAFSPSIWNFWLNFLFVFQFRKLWKNLDEPKVFCHGIRSALLISIGTGRRISCCLHRSIQNSDSFVTKIFFKFSFIFFRQILCVAPSDIETRNLTFYPIMSPKISAYKGNVSTTRPHDNLRILWASRLEYPKLPLVLLEALQRLDASSYKCQIMGSGTLYEPLHTYSVKNGLAVSFLPWGDLTKIFKENDIFVLISEFEGVPFVLQEAMAHGLPIICSDLPGNRFLGGHSFLYAQSSVECATHIQSLQNLDFYDETRKRIQNRWNQISSELNSEWRNIL